MKYIKYHEYKKHGTFDFPMEFYHVTPSHPRYEMSYHWHIEHEIIRILQGEMLVTLNDTEFTAREGDLIYIRGGALHGGIPKNCIYECIVFQLNSLFTNNATADKKLKQLEAGYIRPFTHFPAKTSDISQISDPIFEAMRGRGSGKELTVIGGFYRLYGAIFSMELYTRSVDTSEKNMRRIEQLKNVLHMIETSYDHPITLDEMAAAAGMNAKYFCRFFHEMTHRTPIDYLNYYRIEQACFLLATSGESITDVGLSCGFNDTSYFIKTFKKYKGVTPKKYVSAPL